MRTPQVGGADSAILIIYLLSMYRHKSAATYPCRFQSRSGGVRQIDGGSKICAYLDVSSNFSTPAKFSDGHNYIKEVCGESQEEQALSVLIDTHRVFVS